VKEQPNFSSLFFLAFPSDPFLKATKNVNVCFFIHNSNSNNLYQRIPVNFTSAFPVYFEAATYFHNKFLLIGLKRNTELCYCVN
jgi:hypothetical protein